MDPKYTRKSISDSLHNEEKEVIEKNVISDERNTTGNGFMKTFGQNWDKYVYTFCILYNYISYGLTCNLFALAMVDFKVMFRTSMANINLVSTCRSVGYLCGSLFGFLYKYINRQLSFIMGVTMMGVFICSVTECQRIWQLYVFYFLFAMGGGIWDSGNAVWTIELWGPRSSIFLQLSQVCFGLGSILGPVLVRPFVLGDLNRTESDGSSGSFSLTTTLPIYETTVESNENINDSVDRRPKLRIPHTISGAFCLLGPIILLVMFFVKRYKSPERESETLSEKNNNTIENEGNATKGQPLEQSPRIRKLLIALVALLLNSESSMEIVYFGYLSAYLQYLPDVHISASKAALLFTITTITYTSGRVVSSYISTKLSAEVMLMYHLMTIGISYAILYLGQNMPSLQLIYVGNAIIGFGFSAMWPAIFTFSEHHIRLTNKITAIFSFVSQAFTLTTPFIIGPLIETHPQVFLIINTTYFCSFVILFIIIMFIVKRSQRYPIMYTINEIN